MSVIEHFRKMIRDEQENLRFFEETGARLFDFEGLSVRRDVTDETIRESERRIKMLEGLIKHLEEKGAIE